MMINKADTLFVLICATLMVFMTPNVGTFYADLAGKKNGTTSIIYHWLGIGIVTVLWLICGFSLAYGADHLGVVGGLEYFLLDDVGFTPNKAFSTISSPSPIVFFMLQVVIAAWVSAVVFAGAVEKLNLKAYILLVLFWGMIVYIPQAHMVWGNGILTQIGLLDYAGGTVVHTSIGFSALAVAKYMGDDYDYYANPENEQKPINNVGILFGWILFNGSIGLGVNSNSIYAFVNSFIGSGAGMITWVVLSMFAKKKVEFTDVVYGFLAGVIGVAAGAAYITPKSGILIGIITTLICYVCMQFRDGFPVKDTPIIWVLHGVGGLIGTISICIFANPAQCTFPLAMGRQLITQVGCVYAIAIGSFALTWIIFIVVEKIVPLNRPKNLEEEIWLEILESRKKKFLK